MDRNRWTRFVDAEPEESACLDGWLLVWHVYRGVVAEKWEDRHDTPMYTHWRPMPRSGWIDAAQRKPTAEDGDIMCCVLARHKYDGIRVTGWVQFELCRYYTHWQRTPEPPVDHRAYFNMF